MTSPTLTRTPQPATRYRRGALAQPVRRARGAADYSALVADVARPAEVDIEVIAPGLAAPSTTRPTMPAAEPKAEPKRGIIGWYSRRMTAVAAAVTAAVLGVGVMATGAYFTDFTALTSSALPGTVTLDVLAANGTASPTFTVQNIVPLSTGDAADTAKGTFATFKLKGATLNTKARITVQAVDTGTTVGVLPWVQMSIWNGTTWTTPAAPSSTVAALSDQLTVAKNTNTADLKVRFFLKPDTPNYLQGATIKFTVGTKSIQSIGPDIAS